MTPTARTLAECRKRGWIAQVVEQTIPRTFIKRDLFGIIDIIAVTPPTAGVPDACQCEAWGEQECACGGYQDMMGHPGRIIGIQATSGSNHAARITKAKSEPRLAHWVAAGARFEIWSWAKQGARGKRKKWTLRVEEVTP
jgi:hypothetical protein